MTRTNSRSSSHALIPTSLGRSSRYRSLKSSSLSPIREERGPTRVFERLRRGRDETRSPHRWPCASRRLLAACPWRYGNTLPPPVTGPFPILVAFSEPVTGVELEEPGRRQRQRLRAAGEQRDLHRNDHARDLRHRDGGHRGRRGAGQRREPERGGRPVLHHRGPDAGAGSAPARRDRALPCCC